MGFEKSRHVVNTKPACLLACARAHSCPTLGNSMDCSPPGSSVHGILQEEYWSGLSFPPPGHLPNPGIKPASPVTLALAGRFFTTELPGKPGVKSEP